MHIEDAAAFVVDSIARPRAGAAYSEYGYDVYVPNAVAAYLAEIEKIPQHLVPARTFCAIRVGPLD